jgi:hypothetical protein
MRAVKLPMPRPGSAVRIGVACERFVTSRHALGLEPQVVNAVVSLVLRATAAKRVTCHGCHAVTADNSALSFLVPYTVQSLV